MPFADRSGLCARWLGLARKALSVFAIGVVALSTAVAIGAQPAMAAPGPSFTNPVVGVPNSADPTLVHYNGSYPYVATTWNADVVMRQSTTIAGLRSAPEQVVVRTGGTVMWAPHRELINNRWYLYYSVEQAGGPRRTHVAESSGTNPL